MADLFYVIGASGSGKDSLIEYARQHMPTNVQVVFTHRYITRPADAGGENHVALDTREFHARQQMGCFAMSWFSHDTHYGIGIEINQWLGKGLDVVLNGSRAYLHDAAQKYHELRPILVSVRPEVLQARLQQRGRETAEQIERRLQQARRLEKQVSHPRLIKIDNNTAIADAGEKLIRAIHDNYSTKCA
jgi:ribose 1,5-bisphosphokinase